MLGTVITYPNLVYSVQKVSVNADNIYLLHKAKYHWKAHLQFDSFNSLTKQINLQLNLLSKASSYISQSIAFETKLVKQVQRYFPLKR